MRYEFQISHALTYSAKRANLPEYNELVHTRVILKVPIKDSSDVMIADIQIQKRPIEDPRHNQGSTVTPLRTLVRLTPEDADELLQMYRDDPTNVEKFYKECFPALDDTVRRTSRDHILIVDDIVYPIPESKSGFKDIFVNGLCDVEGVELSWFNQVKADPRNYLEIPSDIENKPPLIKESATSVVPEVISETPIVVENQTVSEQPTDLDEIVESITQHNEAFGGQLNKIDPRIPQQIAKRVYEFRQKNKGIDVLYVIPTKDQKEFVISFSPAAVFGKEAITPKGLTIALPREMGDKVIQMYDEGRVENVKEIFKKSFEGDMRLSDYLDNNASTLVATSDPNKIDLNMAHKYKV